MYKTVTIYADLFDESELDELASKFSKIDIDVKVSPSLVENKSKIVITYNPTRLDRLLHRSSGRHMTKYKTNATYQDVLDMQDNGMTAGAIAKRLGMSVSTLYRRLKVYEFSHIPSDPFV